MKTQIGTSYGIGLHPLTEHTFTAKSEKTLGDATYELKEQPDPTTMPP